MDVNGTRFHLLLGERDWARCHDDSATLAGAGAPPSLLGLATSPSTGEQTLRPLLFHFVAGSTDRAPTLADRRGAARDRFGNWYWIDADAETIRVKSRGSGVVSDFWPVAAVHSATAAGGFGPIAPAAPAPRPQLGGLAVTSHHYLLVGTIAPKGFLLFDLHAGGPPQVLQWPAGIDFSPFDIAAKPDGGACVLDRSHRRYWTLDPRFRVCGADQEAGLVAADARDDFQPQDGGPPRQRLGQSFPLGIDLGHAAAVPAADPIAIEVMPDGGVVVLDRGAGSGGQVLRFRGGAPHGLPVRLHIDGLLVDGSSFSHALVPHDFAYVTTAGAGRLYVVTTDGNQAFAFAISDHEGALVLEPLMEYLPMRLFQGKALVGGDDGAHYDHPGGFAPLVAQKRPRYTQQGMLTTPALDGREPGCVWHRLLIDGRIPDGALVEVTTRAADDPRDLESLPFVAEPLLYRRTGGELPFLSPAAIGDRETWELLFQRARGRFLQIRLRLSGDGRVTPRLRALRAWYPRFSYLTHYLPAVYQEDPQSASFLDRFLANPEGLFTAIEDRIAAAQVLFDVRSAPPDALDWLASWFGVALDPAWDEARRRLFIRHAMLFFQYRGTVRGLRMALRLALEPCADERIFTEPDDPIRSRVRIVERFRARSAPAIFSGDASEPLGIRFGLASAEPRWNPSQGRETLHQRWAEAMNRAGLAGPAEFPITAPVQPALAQLWSDFAAATLGFRPAAGPADASAWQEFLAGRYRDVAAYNVAHGAAIATFTELASPTSLPVDGAPLQDWYQFEAIVLPMHQTAHRFRVLVPAPLGSGSADARARSLELARRVVELEKPAHTSFEVRFYYALFRVGEARLGLDSLIALGGRAPDLMAPFVLGPTHLAEGYLAPRSTRPARAVLGRDRLDA